MGLCDLPAELRVRIYDFLPDLQSDRHETVAPNIRITPALCRTNRQLRAEALPIYVQNSHFVIQADDDPSDYDNRVATWLRAIGPVVIGKVKSIQLSRHWKIPQPSRWQGHVGFYVRLERLNTSWQCTTGTYPIAKDMRGMRLESVEVLHHIVRQRLSVCTGLTAPHVEFVLNAMDVVASHPITAYDVDQGESGSRAWRGIWMAMQRELLALGCSNPQSHLEERKLFTPY